MRNENFITIQGWMVNELGLSGCELLCYALIYGFSQDGESYFAGGRKYIAELIGAKSLNTVDTNLSNLIARGLVLKTSETHNGVITNKYSANLDIPFFKKWGGCLKFEQGCLKFEHDIYSNNIDKQEIKENTKRKKEDTKPTDEEHAMFEEFRKRYTGKKRGHDTEFNFFISQNKDWRDVLPMLGYAIEKENALREQARMMNKFFPEQKNMQTYLNGKNRAWEVYASDIEHYDKNEYRPQCDGVSLFWNELQQCYITPFDVTTLADGYNANNRPNGAAVVWRGWKYVWDGQTKKWEQL